MNKQETISLDFHTNRHKNVVAYYNFLLNLDKNKGQRAGFEVLTAVVMNVAIFWDTA
jgi:hypothetical protein